MSEVVFLSELQSIFQPLESVLRWISLHAYSKHYLFLAAVIYWLGYRTLAARLSCAVVFSTLLFGSCRQFFPSSRPYWAHPELFRGVAETAYGMPSGHSQNAVVFWGTIAFSLRTFYVILISIVMISTIAVSRMYLGLHFPSQVICGLMLGCVLLFCSIVFEKKILGCFSKFNKIQQFVIAAFLGMTPFLIVVFLREVCNIGEGNGSHSPYRMMAYLTGMAVGITTALVLTWHEHLILKLRFRLVRTVLGALTLYALHIGLSAVSFEYPHNIYQYMFEMFRGVFLAWWAVWFWPCIYRVLILRNQDD